MDLQTILSAVESWSPKERLELIDRLWEGLPDGDRPEGVLNDEQRHDLDRRLAAAERDPDAGAPWNEVQARLRRRLA